MKTKTNQVERTHYYNGYDTKERFISYHNQIESVLKTEPESVLEIGKGNGTVSDYLRKRVQDVTTVDIDPELNPDVVASVDNLPFSKDSFDTVLCAEVLEHLPFDAFDDSLKEISRVAENKAVISLPHAGMNIRFSVKIIPFVEEKSFLLKLPVTRLFEHEFDGEHYWEIGKKRYSLSKIREIISQHFDILNSWCDSRGPYHRFFELEVVE